MLVALHGGGDTGAHFEASLDLDSIADLAGLITVYPDIDFASQPNDAPFIRTLVAHLKRGLAVDAGRVYVAGFSGGAELTHTLACEFADHLAGAASVSYPMTRKVAVNCEPARPLPVLFMHGTADAAAPWVGHEDVLLSIPTSVRTWAKLNDCVLDPTVEWLPDRADDSTRVWTETYSGCAGSVEVKLYGVQGGGHSWPGASGSFGGWSGAHSFDISASEEIVNFFLRYSAGGN
jgi:polyhydroxybutyrate depolymerase